MKPLYWMITWKLLLGKGDISGARNEQFFAGEQDFPPICRISPKGLGEGVGQSIPGWGQQARLKKGDIFGKMGDTRGIIQGNNSEKHCFVLSDLILMNFFK